MTATEKEPKKSTTRAGEMLAEVHAEVPPLEPPPSVHQAIARVIGDLPGLGKDAKNAQQGFNYRSHEAVMAALKPLLARHGVVIVPDVVERLYEQRPTAKGGIMHTVHLHVRYRVYGPAGDFVEASGWGEGTDSGDKATNKAMTGALKYVIFCLFAIADGDGDSDATTPEPTVARRAEDENAQALGYSDGSAMGALLTDYAAKVKAKGAGDHMRTYRAEKGYSWPPTHAQLLDLLDQLEAAPVPA